ncbi:ABC transporter permease [Metasolibacillus meyeri]|uniref:ABC transporter permease n=1 Tax=Metasolibacillus meyeri TaxID=1071052 RepID=A0AAW9NV18_9BACL|nr:FtsX-like permease family protein [Metasolibacillus meyeri]MEC1178118.1 ABC transporter permease [Metasolibacillus meyeri]
MTIRRLITRSMLKNMRHYFLYFFSLIFSVTLYFSFVTLQFNDEVLEQVSNSSMAATGFKAASYLLYFIVLFFVLYANHLFTKRRSKEIGMYQLIGMTKGLIFRLIAFENFVLFSGAVLIGVVTGLLSSRFFTLILIKILEQDVLVRLTFSSKAIMQTLGLFGLLLLVILAQLYWLIRRVSLLSLFTASHQTEERVKRFSVWQMSVGVLGILLIVYGYYESTQLFADNKVDALLRNMLLILASTIGGAFLVFRYSVAFIFNLRRLSKNGHLTTTDVLAVTPIMHRMKGNAKSLTLITVLTAVSLAISTLAYISYYSAEKAVKNVVPADYALVTEKGPAFLALLDEHHIDYQAVTYEDIYVKFDVANLLKDPDDVNQIFYGENASKRLISQSTYEQLQGKIELAEDEAILTNMVDSVTKVYEVKKQGEIDVMLETLGNRLQDKLKIVDVRRESTLTQNGSNGVIYAVLVVSDAKYEQYKEFYGERQRVPQTLVFLEDRNDILQAEELYIQSGADIRDIFELDGKQIIVKQNSYQQEWQEYMSIFGMTIFIAAFLGLAFLLTTGSILYFKQVAEADEEQASYTTLRKIGFSEQDILKGIIWKQIFNFGVPLLIGLLHSYFAVKSGWFFFGAELVAPMLIMMALYIFMYLVFMLLSVHYYKKVVKGSL